MKTDRVAEYGLLITLALVMSYIESNIPAFFAVPGMKLGLTNVVVLFALYRMDWKSAVIINLFRILITGLLFGNGVSIAYSVAGGVLSGLVMVLFKEVLKLSAVTVSVAGGLFHNIGQILVAMAVLGTRAVAWYLVVLWFSGIVAGFAVGLLGVLLIKRVPSRKNG